MKLEVDKEVNAAYVRLDETAKVAKTKRLDKQRIVDYDDHGEIVGIEFLGVSKGVNLDDLPHKHELEQLFEERGYPVYA